MNNKILQIMPTAIENTKLIIKKIINDIILKIFWDSLSILYYVLYIFVFKYLPVLF